MIDTLEANLYNASILSINNILSDNLIKDYSAFYASKLSKNPVLSRLESGSDKYAVITLHRPSNVDKKEILEPIVRFLINEACKVMVLIWPIHPRTKKMLEEFDLYGELKITKNIVLLEPIGYLEMLRLNIRAQIILTDSGGLQEECTILGTPCLTLRYNTERPVTLRQYGGASVLVGNNIECIREEFYSANKQERNPIRPELWDGHTAERCLRAILEFKNK